MKFHYGTWGIQIFDHACPFRGWAMDGIPELGIGRQNPLGNTVVPGGHLPGLDQDATTYT